jgi:hypothetical protein
MAPAARVSPAGKLRLDVWGIDVTVGPTVIQPALLAAVAVRFPATAIAPVGTPPRPATWNVRTAPLLKAPDRPLAKRVSSSRAGGRPTYLAPAGLAAAAATVVAFGACAAAMNGVPPVPLATQASVVTDATVPHSWTGRMILNHV